MSHLIFVTTENMSTQERKHSSISWVMYEENKIYSQIISLFIQAYQYANINIYQNCNLMKLYLDSKRTSLLPAGQLYCAAELNCMCVHCFVNTTGPSSSPLPRDVGSEIRRYQSADVSSQFDGTLEFVPELQAALLMVLMAVDP